jgi:hypothetical protein
MGRLLDKSTFLKRFPAALDIIFFENALDVVNIVEIIAITIRKRERGISLKKSKEEKERQVNYETIKGSLNISYSERNLFHFSSKFIISMKMFYRTVRT